MMGSYPWLWFIGGLLLIGGEIVLPGVYLLWIGLGALVVGVLVAVFPDLGLTWQLVSFALAMLGTVSLGFVIQRRGAPPAAGELNQELHALVGQRFVAVSDFQVGMGRAPEAKIDVRANPAILKKFLSPGFHLADTGDRP